MEFIYYAKCTTCQKAKKYLDDNGINYKERDIKLEHPSEEDIRRYHKLSNLPLKKFFNTSGILYRQMNLKDRINDMDEQQMYQLLASDGMLVKRPLVVMDDCVIVGFDKKLYQQLVDKLARDFQ